MAKTIGRTGRTNPRRIQQPQKSRSSKSLRGAFRVASYGFDAVTGGMVLRLVSDDTGQTMHLALSRATALLMAKSVIDGFYLRMESLEEPARQKWWQDFLSYRSNPKASAGHAKSRRSRGKSGGADGCRG